MKAIMVMFDSLNRHMLPAYGCDWVHAPNFQRLCGKTVVFDQSFVGSMPCMPARREIHTGRYNFLHRSWGPLEPFDDSMPDILKRNKVHTHLVSDHYHYWETGGCTYHPQYSTWEIVRGQEGDPWKGEVSAPPVPEHLGQCSRQDMANRGYMREIADQPQAKTFAKSLDFLEKNHKSDNWFLQIETFDPHEPYFCHEKYKKLYPHKYTGPLFDWPPYRKVTEPDEAIAHIRYENAALISMCDEHLGKILDFMDSHDMWKDTMLIVNTDHGFLLGEHDLWAKCHIPFYNEIARTPFWIWDPRSGKTGERRNSLVQTIDIAPTLLDFFNVDIPADMQGKPLEKTVADDTPVREAALFGLFGAHVNVTDGRYVYMRAPVSPDNKPLYEYTLMPTHMRTMFHVSELQNIELAEPFSFTKGCRTMKIEGRQRFLSEPLKTMLFDNDTDPRQLNPLNNRKVEDRMTGHLARLMRENEAPDEQFQRLGIP